MCSSRDKWESPKGHLGGGADPLGEDVSQPGGQQRNLVVWPGAAGQAVGGPRGAGWGRL